MPWAQGKNPAWREEVFSERVESFALTPGYAFDRNPGFWAHGPRSLAVRIVATR